MVIEAISSYNLSTQGKMSLVHAGVPRITGLKNLEKTKDLQPTTPYVLIDGMGGPDGKIIIWPEVTVHGLSTGRSLRHDLGPNIFLSGLT